jgi:aminopeptidase
VTPDPAAFAALLCDWCLDAREGDQVLVAATVPSMPLALAVHGALLERGAWPLMRLSAAALAERQMLS